MEEGENQAPQLIRPRIRLGRGGRVLLIHSPIMLDFLAAAGLFLLAFFLLLPVYWAWRFALLFPPRSEKPVPDLDLPRAGVVLCLRGTDPSLESCLAALLAQDYPSYAVWLVIDSEEDPAWHAVTRILQSLPKPIVPVHVRVLEEHRETCSLKLSAQLQALAELRDDGCQVVAFIDADVVPAPDWLRALIMPLLEPQVGASCGIRWYTPTGKSWGTLVRYLWNGAALTQMFAFTIPWGGSLAFRLDVIGRAGLLEQWASSFCEDTSSPGRLTHLGLKIRIVPAAWTINSETTDLRSSLTFIRRQLVCTRLHHPRWPAIVAVNTAHVLALVTALTLGTAGWLFENWLVAGVMAGLVSAFAVGLVAALFRGERALRRLARDRGIELPTFSLSWRAWLACPLTQVLHVGCLVSALAVHRIAWRGITYLLEGRGKIRMLKYHPYRGQKESAAEATSLV